MHIAYTSYAILSRQTTEKAREWEERLTQYLHEKHPQLACKHVQEADLLLVIGGDGTVLEAVRASHESPSDLLAFHTGHVGFLSSVRDESRFLETLEAALQDKLIGIKIPILHVRHLREEQEARFIGVNDLLIEQTMTWVRLRIETRSGQEITHVKDMRGSGVCICTPIGSTTPMALHAQAPKMDPALPALYLKGTNDAEAPATGLLLSAIGQSVRITVTGIEPNLGIPEERRHGTHLYVDGIHATDIQVSDIIEVNYGTTPKRLLRDTTDTHWSRVRALAR